MSKNNDADNSAYAELLWRHISKSFNMKSWDASGDVDEAVRNRTKIICLIPYFMNAALYGQQRTREMAADSLMKLSQKEPRKEDEFLAYVDELERDMAQAVLAFSPDLQLKS